MKFVPVLFLKIETNAIAANWINIDLYDLYGFKVSTQMMKIGTFIELKLNSEYLSFPYLESWLYITGAHLRISEGRGTNFWKGENQYKTNKKRM